MENADKDWVSERTVVSTCSEDDACSLCCNDLAHPDDMEVAGLALGAISLAGPLASTCLSGYGLLKSIDAVDGDAADLQLLVEAQRTMLERWIAQHIVEGQLRGGGRLGERGCVVVAALLARISETLADTDLLDKGYGIAFRKTVEDIQAKLGATTIMTTGDPGGGGSGLGSDSGATPAHASSMAPDPPPAVDAITAVPTKSSASASSSSSSSGAARASQKQKEKDATQGITVTASRRSSTTSSPNPTPGPSQRPQQNLGSWLSRAWCFKIHRRRRPRPPPPAQPQPQPQKPHPTGATSIPKPLRRESTVHSLLLNNADLIRTAEDCSDTQIMGILAALEDKQSTLQTNVSRLKGLKWVLVDKAKAETLVSDLRKWNKQLFEILPVSHGLPGSSTAAAPGKNTRFRIIPHTASPLFTGRLPALAQLHRTLVEGKSNVQRRAVLHGIGGAGKTQIALKFIEEYRDQFDSIFWIDASSAHAIEKSFADIATTIPLGTGDPRKMFLHWLSHHADRNWLLVYDNADAVSDLHRYFPATYHGNILITSRNPGTQDYVRDHEEEAYHVDGMDPSDAVALLLNACRLSKEEKADARNRAHAEEVVRAVGYLALAIDQAGAYIFRRKCGIEHYLKLYKTDRSTLLELRGYEGSGYTKAVYQTWKLSFDALFEKNPAAAELLQVFAYFHWNSIPIEIFETVAPFLAMAKNVDPVEHNEGGDVDGDEPMPGPTLTLPLPALNGLLQQCVQKAGKSSKPTTTTTPSSPSSPSTSTSLPKWESTPFEMAIYEIESYSLVDIHMNENHKARYSIHPLVHSWIRDQGATNENIARAAEILLGQTVVNAAGPMAYAIRSSLVSHLDSWLYPTLESHMNHHHHHPQQQQQQQPPPPLFNQTTTVPGSPPPGPTDSTTPHSTPKELADLMETISPVYHETGRLEQAERLRLEVFQWRKDHLGLCHPTTLLAQQNLAATYRRRAKYDQAEQLDLAVLSQTQTTTGSESAATWDAKLSLAWTYAEKGQFALAERLEREVIAGRERVLGARDIRVAVARGNLGMTLWRMGRYADAEAEFRFSLERKTEVYGEVHPGVLLAKGNLASAVRGQGRFEEAERLNREVVETRVRLLGRCHQDVGRALSHLGYTLMEAGKVEEALVVEKEALGILAEIVGEYHLFTMDVRCNIGLVYTAMKKWEDAEEAFVQVLKAREAVLGVEHFQTKEARENLAKVFEFQGRMADARELRGMLGDVEGSAE